MGVGVDFEVGAGGADVRDGGVFEDGSEGSGAGGDAVADILREAVEVDADGTVFDGGAVAVSGQDDLAHDVVRGEVGGDDGETDGGLVEGAEARRHVRGVDEEMARGFGHFVAADEVDEREDEATACVEVEERHEQIELLGLRCSGHRGAAGGRSRGGDGRPA